MVFLDQAIGHLNNFDNEKTLLLDTSLSKDYLSEVSFVFDDFSQEKFTIIKISFF